MCVTNLYDVSFFSQSDIVIWYTVVFDYEFVDLFLTAEALAVHGMQEMEFKVI